MIRRTDISVGQAVTALDAEAFQAAHQHFFGVPSLDPSNLINRELFRRRILLEDLTPAWWQWVRVMHPTLLEGRFDCPLTRRSLLAAFEDYSARELAHLCRRFGVQVGDREDRAERLVVGAIRQGRELELWQLHGETEQLAGVPSTEELLMRWLALAPNEPLLDEVLRQALADWRGDG